MREQLTHRFTTLEEQVKEQVKVVADRYTETNDRVLDTVVDANRKVVDFAVKTVDQIADRVSQQAPAMRVDVPFADRLPSPADAGARYIELVERLAEANRDFSERVVAMLPTVTETKAPAKKAPAKKAAAKKAAAKKAAGA